MSQNDALERAARAVAEAAGNGCFERIDQSDCGCDDDCADHEDAAYYRSLARAALVSANVIPPRSWGDDPSQFQPIYLPIGRRGSMPNYDDGDEV